MPYDYQDRWNPAHLEVFRDAPEEFILKVNHINVRLSIGSFLSTGQTWHQILFFKLTYVENFPVPPKSVFHVLVGRKFVRVKYKQRDRV